MKHELYSEKYVLSEKLIVISFGRKKEIHSKRKRVKRQNNKKKKFIYSFMRYQISLKARISSFLNKTDGFY